MPNSYQRYWESILPLSHVRLPTKDLILQRNNGSQILYFFSEVFTRILLPALRVAEHVGQMYSKAKFVSKLRLQFSMEILATAACYHKPTKNFDRSIQLEIVQRYLQRFGGLYPHPEQTLCFPKRAIS